MKTSSFNNLFHHKKTSINLKESNIVNLSRDWKLVLASTFCVIVALIVWSLYLFDHVRKDDFIKIKPVPPIVKSSIKEKKLETVSNIFAEKAKVHEILKHNPLPISDPSR
jgi:hypothetical protein